MSTLSIQAPLPGIFYHKPAPDAAPFKQNGDSVAVGDTIGMIEVMKSFHEIPADVAGENIRYLVEDAEAIMAGQVLAEVDVVGSDS